MANLALNFNKEWCAIDVLILLKDLIFSWFGGVMLNAVGLDNQ